MKRPLFLAIVFCVFISNLLHAQDSIPPAKSPKPERKNLIVNGFYFQLGPVFPQGEYAALDTVPVSSGPLSKTSGIRYHPARIGAALDMGFLIYIGPSVINKRVRIGIDATFLTLSFNSIKLDSTSSVSDKYYYFVGQKFGPVISINPIDHLMIDVSYKLNANFGIHDEWGDTVLKAAHSTYGANLFQNEVSLALR